MTLRVLIVGGGVAGLTTAVALRRRGIAAEIVERRARWPAEGAAITLHANGVRVLRALGLGEAIDRGSTALPQWTFYGASGRTLCSTDLQALWGHVGPCVGITRVRLQEALLGGATGVRYRLGVAVTGITQDGGPVVVTFSDGSSSRYDLVIGADGVRSAVRRLVITDAAPTVTHTMGWRSVAAVRPAGVTHLMTFMGAGCVVGLVPVGDGQTYCFAAVETDAGQEPVPGRLERIRRQFRDFAEPVRTYLDALRCDDELHATRIEWVELDRWHAGRVLLVGDAAHAAPPHMGEGGCLAMEDALVLADVVSGHPDLDAALETYTARRRPRVDWVHQQSRVAERAWMLPPATRDATLRERGDQLLQDRYRPLLAHP
jgi:2-polyprenyl-6-methoxyphenol hydroxylase-like FAD-dependent oxidoreductase